MKEKEKKKKNKKKKSFPETEGVVIPVEAGEEALPMEADDEELSPVPEKEAFPLDRNERKLQFYQNKDSAVINAYDHVVFNIIEEQTLHGYKSFLFCGCEPQVGTTSIVIELGIILANLGKRVLILDGDFRRVSTRKRLHDIAERGMSDYIGNPDIELADCIYASNVDGLYALSSGKMGNQHARQILYSPRFMEALDQLKRHFDIILVDSCALDTTSDVLALASFSDAVVLICALNGSPKSKLVKAHQKLTKIKCNLIGVIENMVDMREYEAYMDNYNYYSLLPDRSGK